MDGVSKNYESEVEEGSVCVEAREWGETARHVARDERAVQGFFFPALFASFKAKKRGGRNPLEGP